MSHTCNAFSIPQAKLHGSLALPRRQSASCAKTGSSLPKPVPAASGESRLRKWSASNATGCRRFRGLCPTRALLRQGTGRPTATVTGSSLRNLPTKLRWQPIGWRLPRARLNNVRLNAKSKKTKTGSAIASVEKLRRRLRTAERLRPRGRAMAPAMDAGVDAIRTQLSALGCAGRG